MVLQAIKEMLAKPEKRTRNALIAGQDREFVELLRTYLDAIGCGVTVVPSPEAAMDMLQATARHRLLILDTSTAAAGIGFLKKLRRHPATKALPVLLILSKAGPEALHTIHQEFPGVDAMAKPVKMRRVQEAVDRVFTTHCTGRV